MMYTSVISYPELAHHAQGNVEPPRPLGSLSMGPIYRSVGGSCVRIAGTHGKVTMNDCQADENHGVWDDEEEEDLRDIEFLAFPWTRSPSPQTSPR